MKKLILASALAVAGLASMQAHALTATGGFNVSVSLFPKCEFTTSPTPTLNLRYVSFQTTDSVNDLTYNFRCTTSLPYALSLTGTQATGQTLAAVGLAYTLTLPGTTSGTGTGLTAIAATVRGTIASGQAGTCATAQTGTSGSQDPSANGTTGGVGTACTASSTAGDHVLTITY